MKCFSFRCFDKLITHALNYMESIVLKIHNSISDIEIIDRILLIKPLYVWIISFSIIILDFNLSSISKGWSYFAIIIKKPHHLILFS